MISTDHSRSERSVDRPFQIGTSIEGAIEKIARETSAFVLQRVLLLPVLLVLRGVDL